MDVGRMELRRSYRRDHLDHKRGHDEHVPRRDSRQTSSFHGAQQPGGMGHIVSRCVSGTSLPFTTWSMMKSFVEVHNGRRARRRHTKLTPIPTRVNSSLHRGAFLTRLILLSGPLTREL